MTIDSIDRFRVQTGREESGGGGENSIRFSRRTIRRPHTHTIVVTPKKILGETIKKSHNEVGD